MTSVDYECHCCGEGFEDLRNRETHRQTCAKRSSNKTLFSEVDKAFLVLANKINDLRFTGYYSDQKISELLDKVSELQRQV